MNAQHYRTMRRDFLRLARMAGAAMFKSSRNSITWTFNIAARQAYRHAAARMAAHYPLILERGLDVYDVTCPQRRNRLKRDLQAEIAAVTA